MTDDGGRKRLEVLLGKSKKHHRQQKSKEPQCNVKVSYERINLKRNGGGDLIFQKIKGGPPVEQETSPTTKE